ncbi:tetratricopeptide repeat protein 28-like [Porites lutea]|uniref:tetratricopeptide repeat protein 28-like n=1 Tax=Porites lutea TaxID=51062 RepID=UPI003CC6D5A8
MFKEGNKSEGKSNAFVSFEKMDVIRRLQVHDTFKISYFDKNFSLNYRWLSQFLCDAGFTYEALYTEEFRRARALTDLMAARYCVENEIPVSAPTWDYIKSIVKKECNCACLYISYYGQLINFWVVKADNSLIFRQIKVNDVFGSVCRVAELLCREIYRDVLCLAPEQCEDRSWLPSDVYWEQGCERLIGEDENQPPERTPARVYKMIIAPVADCLDEKEIIIVPDRYLYKVPFAALEDESGKCLSESFRIRIVPSLTTLKLIQDSPADYHSQTGVLIVGNPKVGEVLYKGDLQQISRLPSAKKEAKMIGKLCGTQPLLGKQATKQAVLQNIHSVSLIHFACHGDAERGEIVLAPPPLTDTDRTPQEEDYLLTMEDISKVQLQAKLVVLSCCHSAKGQISAEGVVGIARAFLGSGARSVLVALWAIEDEATKDFMSRFYENLVRGESASESLQQAMKWMRENGYSEMSQWAPFMLIGDNVTLDFHKLRLSKGQ